MLQNESFQMDQIISLIEKRDFQKIFFVIRDAHVSRDT